MEPAADLQKPGALGEIARLFLRIGVLGFGGPAAHIAMMRDEVVRRRRWLDDGEFLELVGATNLIPGPNSTELAIHLGHRRAGARGLLVGGVCFILPAVVIVSVLAWSYAKYGTNPAVVDLRYGVLPVIISIVGHALFGMGRTALSGALPIAIALASFAGYLAGVHELVLVAGGGLIAAGWEARHRLARHTALALLPVLAVETEPAPVSLRRLFLIFLEIGSVLYGSGYVLLAYLQRHFVDRTGWLTDQQLLDAVAVGQVTPGPLFTTATFVGWQVDGPAGAALATLGIFLPSFVFVALLQRIVPWMRSRPVARGFLRGVTIGSLGLMAGVLVDLVDVALTDAATIVIACASLGVLIRTSLNSAWLIGAGLLIGVVQAIAG